MRTLTNEEMNQVAGAGANSGAGGDKVPVLSDILSNILNHSANGNTVLSNNNILNFVGNSVSVDLL